MPWVPGGGSPGLLVVALWPQHEAHIYSPHLENLISVVPASCVFWVINEGGCLHIEFGAGSTTHSSSVINQQHRTSGWSGGSSRARSLRASRTGPFSKPNSTWYAFHRRNSAIWGEGGSTQGPQKPLLQLCSLGSSSLHSPVAPFFLFCCKFSVKV